LIRPDRDQLMLLPVDVREWIPEDDLVWHVLDVVAELDLEAFYARYRMNGQGAAAYDPAMMIAVVVYAHAVGVKSSRAIERACTRDAGFKIAAGMLVPDHSTITRFLKNHQEAVSGLFAQVLRLCRAAGMARLGVIAIDGTKIAANASWAKSFTDAALVHQLQEQEDLLAGELAVFAQAGADLVAQQLAVDAAEDEEHGPGGGGRGDDLPPTLRRRADRVAKLKAARADLAAREEHARQQMRAAQQAKQAVYDAKVAAGERPAGPRPKDEVKAGTRAARAGRGKAVPAPRASIIDPDSRRMKTKNGFVQGFNAQVAVSSDQVILAALVSQHPTDHHQLNGVLAQVTTNLSSGASTPEPAPVDPLEPVEQGDRVEQGDPVDPVEGELRRAARRPDDLGVVLADAGYANEDTFKAVHDQDLTLLAPLASDEKRARGEHPDAGRDLSRLPHTATGQTRLQTPTGQDLYKTRGQTVEPTFGQLKDRGGMRQFTRRGLPAVAAEFTLACTIHNIRKLFIIKGLPTPAVA
jgi:transposase